MPIVSNFYGIIVSMYFNEKTNHNLPHLHAEYSDFSAVFDFKGNILDGKFPIKQRKMVEVWISLHTEELNSLWKAMQVHNEFFKIEPLK